MRTLASFVAVPLALAVSAALAAEEELQEVVVTATLRQQSLLDTASSVTVLDRSTLQSAGQQHFQDVLALVPNLNWAGGTSRPRYFQIRGIGEREQYEGAPDPSVGFIIDDIDLSGLGMAATLHDVAGIEVLRGPQGTRFGANALAGLIVVNSAEPEDGFGASTDALFADYDTFAYGLTATGPATSLDSAWRVSVQRYESDGYRDNAFLGREDTDGRTETSARLKWRSQWGANTRADFTLLHADIDDNYDAWSNDNSRTSLSDDPGQDSQRTTGASLRLTSELSEKQTLTVIGALADSNSLHSYDGDWGNPQSWSPFVYDYVYAARRERDTRTLEVRLASDHGSLTSIVGAYAAFVDESLNERSEGVYDVPGDEWPLFVTDDRLASEFDSRNIALFGQLDGAFGERWRWSAGARAEERRADYRENGFVSETSRNGRFDSRDRMGGGHVSLTYAAFDSVRPYVLVSRGYKAGGFNLGFVPDERRRYDTETLTSLEVGVKVEALGGRLYADVAAFSMWRDDVQIRTGDQEDPSDPNSYVFFTDNASDGRNQGIEASARWRLTSELEVGGSLGLLRTEYSGYRPEGIVLPERDQPHAPEYQASAFAAWRHALGWMARLDVSASDNYYFDVPPNNTRSDAYALMNVKIGYEGERFDAYLWARNLLDEDYAVRGFYFINDPAASEPTLFKQAGDPRVVGMNVRFTW